MCWRDVSDENMFGDSLVLVRVFPLKSFFQETFQSFFQKNISYNLKSTNDRLISIKKKFLHVKEVSSKKFLQIIFKYPQKW